MLIGVDDSGCGTVASIEGFAEEPLRCLGISLGTQQEVQSVTLLVNGSIKPPASAFDVDINLIDPPRVTGGTQMRTAALFQLKSVSLDPAVDGGMINSQAAFLGQLFDISVTERVAAVPTDTAQDNC